MHSSTANNSSKKISGEGRVTFVGDDFAIISKSGLNGTIYVPANQFISSPSPCPEARSTTNQAKNRKGESDLEDIGGRNVSLKKLLKKNDTEEKNGAKWIAVDQSVRKTRETKRYSDEGVVTHLDDNGQYGYICAHKGNVYFNANAVRPTSTMQKLRKNQRVRFEAVDQPDNVCPWRATDVWTRRASSPPPTSVAAKPRLPHTPTATYSTFAVAVGAAPQSPVGTMSTPSVAAYVTRDLTFSQIVSATPATQRRQLQSAITMTPSAIGQEVTDKQQETHRTTDATSVDDTADAASPIAMQNSTPQQSESSVERPSDNLTAITSADKESDDHPFWTKSSESKHVSSVCRRYRRTIAATVKGKSVMDVSKFGSATISARRSLYPLSAYERLTPTWDDAYAEVTGRSADESRRAKRVAAQGTQLEWAFPQIPLRHPTPFDEVPLQNPFTRTTHALGGFF